jgi:hypothetical protein
MYFNKNIVPLHEEYPIIWHNIKLVEWGISVHERNTDDGLSPIDYGYSDWCWDAGHTHGHSHLGLYARSLTLGLGLVIQLLCGLTHARSHFESPGWG